MFNDNLGTSAVNYFLGTQNTTSIKSIIEINPTFISQEVDTNYIPTETALENIDDLPTPSVVGIVRDPIKWNIKNLIGSDLTISHVGIIYKKTFKKNEVIYRDMSCSAKDGDNPRNCVVKNYKCEEDQCKKTMFLNATSSYPDDYYFYPVGIEGEFACTKNKQEGSQINSTCNRVMSIPLEVTLEKYKSIKSAVGIHLEKIL